MKKYIIVSLIAVTLLGCGKKKEVEEAPVLRPVKYIVVEETSSDLMRDFSGTIKAETESNLSFRIPGTIERKYVKLGDTVNRGDVIAEIEKIDYEVKYQGALANLEQTKAELIRAKADFDRYQILYFNDNVSKAEYDSALAQFKSNQAQVEATAKQVEYDKLQLNYTKLKAPASGIIAEELSEVNENIQAGTPVYVLSVDGDLEVEFFVPESMIGRVRTGTSVLITADAAQEEEIEGVITQVGRVSTGFGRTFPVKAKLQNTPETVKSGMTAQVKLDFKFSEEDVVILPLQSVVTDTNKETYVFVVRDIANGEGTVEKLMVETGKVTTRGIEIISGLAVGDHVVTAGMSKITVGQKVEVSSKEVR